MKGKLMKNRDDIMETLRKIIEFAFVYKTDLDMDETEAINKTLQAYSDFPEWLKGEADLNGK